MFSDQSEERNQPFLLIAERTQQVVCVNHTLLIFFLGTIIHLGMRFILLILYCNTRQLKGMFPVFPSLVTNANFARETFSVMISISLLYS